MLYLDSASTTPPREEVIRNISEVNQYCWGNPNSIHQKGIEAAEILERSRNSISNSLSANVEDIYFSSGATNSNYIALIKLTSHLKPGRIIISDVEHPSIYLLEQELRSRGWDIKRWPVDNYGIIRLECIDKLLEPPTSFISLIWGQSEVGSIQPIEYIGNICRERGIIFHTDATQVFYSMPIKWDKLNVDILSASAHKFRGPKGIGLLLARKYLVDENSFYNNNFNVYYNIINGTPPVSLISGMALALEYIYIKERDYSFESSPSIKKVSKLTSLLVENLTRLSLVELTGHPTKRLKNHISLLIKGTKRPIIGQELVRYLANQGICTSSGTACHKGQLLNSYVLKAMGYQDKYLKSTLRITLGDWLSIEDIEYASELIIKSVNKFASTL